MRVQGEWSFKGVRIPGHWIDDLAAPDKKRFVASDYGWKKLRVAKCQDAMGRCTLKLDGCRNWTALHLGELHHTGPHGRGLGGSQREDRETAWTCRSCHEKAERERTGTRWAGPAVRDG